MNPAEDTVVVKWAIWGAPAHKSGERMPIHFTIDHTARHVEATFDGNLVLKDVEDF